jgi:hypothetical protein
VAAKRPNFYQVISEAIRDFTLHGFDSPARLAKWLKAIRDSLHSVLLPDGTMNMKLRSHLLQRFEQLVSDPKKLLQMHPGVSEFTLRNLEPRFRAALDRRIMASASLIKLNRAQSVERTLQRFAGWATSIPIGGSKAVDKAETAESVRKGLAALPFEERRVIIDQGHKLAASIHHIVMMAGGAIAVTWRHTKRGPPAYDSRPDHVAREGVVYAIRDNWAMKSGFMKLDGHLYYDEITQAGEEPFCSCWVEPIYALQELPRDMLTAAGVKEMARVEKIVRSA